MRLGWSNRLAAMPHPPGLLAEWNLSVVLEASGDEAKVGWTERGNGGASRTGNLYASDLAWARPVRANGGGFGPSPRRITRHPAARRRHHDPARRAPTPPPPPAARHGRTGCGCARCRRSRARYCRSTRHHWPRARHVRRLERRYQPVQPRDAGAAATRQLVQAYRLPDGAAGRHLAQPARARRAVHPEARQRRNMGAEQLRPDLQRPDVPMRIALERSLNMVTIRLAEKVGMDAVRGQRHHLPRRGRDAARAAGVAGRRGNHRAAPGRRLRRILARGGQGRAAEHGGLDPGPRRQDADLVPPNEPVLRRAAATRRRPPVITDARTQIADRAERVPARHHDAGGRVQGHRASQRVPDWAGPSPERPAPRQDSNDAWFVGFTPDLVTAVWVGFDNNTSLGEKRDRQLHLGADLARLHGRRPQGPAQPAVPRSRPTSGWKIVELAAAAPAPTPSRWIRRPAPAAAPSVAAVSGGGNGNGGGRGGSSGGSRRRQQRRRRGQRHGRAILGASPCPLLSGPSHVQRVRHPPPPAQADLRAAEEASLTGTLPSRAWTS